MGIKLMIPPLPKVWANLYMSWNMAFVSMYREAPNFFAKLLAPVVSGSYQEVHQGLYFFPRCVSLWLHIHHELCSRFERRTKGLPEPQDWRSDILALLWGRLNHGAAQEFQKRVEGIMESNHGHLTNLGYDSKRAAVKVLWYALRSMIEGGCAMADGGQDVMDFFSRLTEAATPVFSYAQDDD